MASHFTSRALPILALSLALAVCAQASSYAIIKCENLGKENCTYAVSYSGHRCLLEKSVKRNGVEKYTCRNSFIDAANNLKNWIETDHCLAACGLDRYSLGISSDALLDSRFAQKLCSSQCQAVCPNIVDLYSNLAAGEGVFLPQYCEAQTTGTRRGMAEVVSSGTDGVAAAPSDAEELSSAPSQAMGIRRGMTELLSSGMDGVAAAPADGEEPVGAPSLSPVAL